MNGQKVGLMTGDEIRELAGAASAVVRVRLIGQTADVTAVAVILSRAFDVVGKSAPRANRYDAGQRTYLTLRVRR